MECRFRRSAAVQVLNSRSNGPIVAQNGLGQASYFSFKGKSDGLLSDGMRRLKAFENETTRLKS